MMRPLNLALDITVSVLALALAFAGPAAAPASAQQAPVDVPQPTIELPPELDRVLRDYEAAWRDRDPAALAALFDPDGFVMASGRQPVRGRPAIEAYYTGHGGPLSLRAFAFDMDGTVAWILGGYGPAPDFPDGGKFTLTLRKAEDGRWLITSDMDNRNH